MEIDEPGRHDDAVRVDAVRLLPLEPGHSFEDPVPDHDLTRAFAPRGRVHQPRAPDVEIRHAAGVALAAGAAGAALGPAPATPASRYSNAIRIATPFVT